jgi:hypothetical protein
MTTHRFCQIRPTARALVRAVAEKVGAELLPTKLLLARRTPRHRVIPAVLEEENALVRAQVATPPAVEMLNFVGHDGDGVVGEIDSRHRGHFITASSVSYLNSFTSAPRVKMRMTALGARRVEAPISCSTVVAC